MKRIIGVLLPVLFVAAPLVPEACAYSGDNTIPYLESFEGLPNNYPITNNLGWIIADSTLNAAVTNIPDHGMSSPYLTGSTHTNVLDISGTVSNTFSSVGQDSMQYIYVDILVKPQARMHYPTQFPPADNDFSQEWPLTVAWVNTNNQLVFYHKWLTPDPDYFFKLVWTTNDVDEVKTGEWNRITFKLSYRSDPTFCDPWFQLQVNGGTPYSNSTVGYSTNQLGPFVGGSPDGGPWFWAADSDAMGEGFLSFGYISVEGIAQVDDMVVTDSEPSSSYTSNGTPVAWLVACSLVTNGASWSEIDEADTNDIDHDGMAAWKEYWTGTIPTDSNSVFKIIALALGGSGTNSVTFLGGTNEDNVPFVIYRSTNLMDADPWASLPYNLYSRLDGIEGTNYWSDTLFAPSNYNAIFYKIEAPLTTP